MANPTDHYKLSGLDVHGTIWQEAADATERLALSLVALDQGKDVLQLDTGHVYKLIVDTGVNEAASWVDISASGTGSEVNDLTAAVTWANIPDGNVPESAVTQHEGAIDHDALANFVAEEHIDWSATGAEVVHADRYTAGGGRSFVQTFLGIYLSTNTTNWTAMNQADFWNASYTQTYGDSSGSPVVPVYAFMPIAPFACKATDVECWYRPGDSSVQGELHLYKFAHSSGTSTVTPTLIGKIGDVATGGASTNRYDISTVFSTGNTLDAGDSFAVFYKASVSGTTLRVYCSVTMEEQ